MKKILTTLLGLSLLLGTVSCGSDNNNEDLEKAKIEAQQQAEAKKKEAIKKLSEAKDLADLETIFEALPKDLQADADIVKAKADKKAELEQKAKDEAEQKAKEKAKQKAIKSLKEAKDLDALNSFFDGLSEELKADADVMKAKEERKAELEEQAKEKAKQEAIKSLKEAKDLDTLNALFEGLSEELKADAEVIKAKDDRKAELEKLNALRWLEGKTFVAKGGQEGLSSVRTLVFKKGFTFTSRFQMGIGQDLQDMEEPVDGTYKYLKPTLRLSWEVPADIYGSGEMKTLTVEYQVDEEKQTITADIQGEIVVFKLVK